MAEEIDIKSVFSLDIYFQRNFDISLRVGWVGYDNKINLIEIMWCRYLITREDGGIWCIIDVNYKMRDLKIN